MTTGQQTDSDPLREHQVGDGLHSAIVRAAKPAGGS